MASLLSNFTIGDLAEVRTGPFGSSLHQSDYVQTGTPIVTVEHLGLRGLIHENLPRVGKADLKRLDSYSCREGDILFSRVGSIDRNSLVKPEENGWLFSGRLLRLRVDPKLADPRYLSQLFQTRKFKDDVRAVAVGQTMASLNTRLISGISVSLPDLKEQNRIAEILTDLDSAIDILEDKIRKALAVKLGLMQDLLQGRLRLPGHVSEWKTVSLGEIVSAQRGTMMSRSQSGNGRIPVIAGGKTPAGYTDVSNREGPVITISASGSAGYVSFHSGPIFASDCSTIGPASNYDLDFIFFNLALRQEELYRLQTGGAQPHVHPKDFYTIRIGLPETLEEQIEIGKVIRDSDELVELVKSRRDAAVSLKLGVLQEVFNYDSGDDGRNQD